MKNYRKLFPVVMILLMGLSWYMLFSNRTKEEIAYENYLSEARKYTKTGITVEAIKNYEQALSMKSTVEVYEEVVEYYRSRNLRSNLLEWCEKFCEAYPKDYRSYDALLRVYLEDENYKSCFKLLSKAKKRNVESEYMEEVNSQIAYYYEIDFSAYDDVGVFNSGYCSVKSKDAWGFVDYYGTSRISCKYVKVGIYTESGYAPVIDSEKEPYFITKSGDRILASEDKYTEFGFLIDDIILAKDENEKYVYLDSNMKKLFGDYEDASNMNNGIAAVKEGDKWKIINNKGEEVCKTKYEDVIRDEKNIAYRNERLFVKDNGMYIMIDSSGKQMGEQKFEEAVLFAETTYAAVKIDGKWCFIDKEGKLKSDKTYDGARAYRNGMAAVKIGDKWGFVNEAEELCIEPEYYETKDFSEKGSCFVRIGDMWQLLKIYRLNRED